MVNTNTHRHGWKRFVAFLLGVICALGDPSHAGVGFIAGADSKFVDRGEICRI